MKIIKTINGEYYNEYSNKKDLEIESIELDSKYPITAKWYYFHNIIKHDSRIDKLNNLKIKQQELLDCYFEGCKKDKMFENSTLKYITSKYAGDIQFLLEELKNSYFPHFEKLTGSIII